MIRVSHLSKSYGTQQVLRGIDVDIQDGEIVCILGGSGSGKSVLLRNILGLEHPDDGEVWFDGVEVHRIKEKDWHQLMRQVGMVFQGAALFDSLTIWENVGIRMLEEHEMSQDAIRTEVIDTLAKVKLGEEVLGKLPSEVSGGMQKRIAIARAVIHKPRYLFYDEPTTGLDPASAAAIDDLMEEMAKEENRTSVIVTHDLATVRRLATRVLMLHRGNIRFDGSPENFFNSDDELVRAFLRR